MAKGIIGIRTIHLLKDFAPYLAITIFVLFITYLLTKNISNVYLLFGSKIIIAVVLYVVIMKLSNAKMFTDTVTFLRYRKIE